LGVVLGSRPDKTASTRDGAFLFLFANQLVDLLRQPPLRPDGGVQILPSLRMMREPTEYPIAQRTEIRSRRIIGVGPVSARLQDGPEAVRVCR
jgi:hypothetical protein